ncbi:MAG: HEAT repeat domain-containing protein [Myxococcaceae bacterium]|nr:HEAT repeat domain-containing protein [Myxococcaceae bacterium]
MRVLLVVCAGLAAACTRGEKPVYERVNLELAGNDDASILGWAESDVKAQLEAALKAERFVAAAEVKEPKNPWRIEAAVGLAEVRANDPDAPSKASVGLVLSRRGDDTDREIVGKGTATVKGQSLDERRDAARAALELALKDAASGAALLISLLTKTDAELVALKDERAKELALSLLAERGNPAALEPLLEKLKSDDLDQMRRAIGGLLSLKDLRAVPALIEASRARDDTFQREIVFALGALGGDEAEAYLQIIADGHDLPLMRASAQAALDELKARKAGGLNRRKATP